MKWAAIWAQRPFSGVTVRLADSRREAIELADGMRTRELLMFGGVVFLARVHPAGTGARIGEHGQLVLCAPSAGTTSSSPTAARPSSSSRSVTRRAKRKRKRSSTSNAT